MISFLVGKLIEKHPTKIVLLCGGIGYEIIIPLSTYSSLPELKSEIKIIAHLYIREDYWQIFGFMHEREKELFKLLISISGIGPKVALSVLSGIGIDSFKEAVVMNDLASLTSISGIGKKTAERIIVELKEKFSIDVNATMDNQGSSTNVIVSEIKTDAVSALISLGYTKVQSVNVVNKVLKNNKDKDLSVEDLIRFSLSYT